ncbi:MAG: hypothetical protein RL189_399 [Pseudomonadota bacterium]|jgi:V8-like Glu-specific endopeptidase
MRKTAVSISFFTSIICWTPSSTLPGSFDVLAGAGRASAQESSVPAQVESIHHEKVIGDNNLMPVASDGENLPTELIPLIDAVGQLNVGCTATHLGDGLVLTAGHCISRSPRSGSDNCHLLGVVWGNRGAKPELKSSNCKSVVLRKYDSTYDFALLRVNNPPKASINIDLNFSSQKAPLTMLSFPRMRPLEWSGNCTLYAYTDPLRILKKFLHDCDSEGGSSGAALISTDSLAIVGLHNGASDDLNYGMYISASEELKNALHDALGK